MPADIHPPSAFGVSVALARRSCHPGAMADEIAIIHLDRAWKRPAATVTGHAYCGSYDVPCALDVTVVTCQTCLRIQQNQARALAAVVPNVDVVIQR
jgi:hypothetical protein